MKWTFLFTVTTSITYFNFCFNHVAQNFYILIVYYVIFVKNFVKEICFQNGNSRKLILIMKNIRFNLKYSLLPRVAKLLIHKDILYTYLQIYI